MNHGVEYNAKPGVDDAFVAEATIRLAPSDICVWNLAGEERNVNGSSFAIKDGKVSKQLVISFV